MRDPLQLPDLVLATLPDGLRCRIAVAETPHPRLGTPCWCWTGRLNRNGYGRAWDKGREPVAHRAVYERLVGPIPDGLLLDHQCRNRRRTRPGHTEPVTPAVNTQRGEAVLFQPRDASPSPHHTAAA